jgi:phage baseplate assembly protein W
VTEVARDGAAGHVAFPRRTDRRGRTAGADHETYVRQLVEQVLFTAPGERLNRPTFGAAIGQLLFAPNDVGLGAAAQLTAQTALQTWLGDLLTLHDVTVEADDSTIVVTVAYTVLATGARAEHTFRAAGGVGR